MKVDQKARIPEELATVLATLGVSLRGHRINSRLTQEDIAAKGQFSRQTVARIERGDPSVAWGQVARYAGIIGAGRLLELPAPNVEAPRTRRVRRTSLEKAQQAH